MTEAAVDLASLPRVVVVTRPTEYEQLLARHATPGQAAFFLRTRGEEMEPVQERHRTFERARANVLAAIPPKWRRVEVSRPELDRFLFAPDDIVVALGQDGLVANTAKYLSAGQPVIGINPDPERFEGVLVQHPPLAAADLFADVASGRAPVEPRTMVACALDDGQRLVALNEIFVGHASHQSARYELRVGGRSELQSSSGVVVATGTGQSGWCRSIRHERGSALDEPGPTEPRLTLYVREAWPSVESGAELTEALVDDEPAEIVSRMEAGGVVFGDGIEIDRVDMPWGTRATVGVADQRLSLVTVR
jgi:NAD kinase